MGRWFESLGIRGCLDMGLVLLQLEFSMGRFGVGIGIGFCFYLYISDSC